MTYMGDRSAFRGMKACSPEIVWEGRVTQPPGVPEMEVDGTMSQVALIAVWCGAIRTTVTTSDSCRCTGCVRQETTK